MPQSDIEEWIEQLSDFRTRSAAMDRLVEAGDDAVGPLLKALENKTQEGAVWAIVQCLGDLNVKEAVKPVARLLDDSRHKNAAHEALVKIAGQDFGTTPEPWLSWVSNTPGEGKNEIPDPAMHKTGLSNERLMEVAMQPFNAQWTQIEEGRFKVEMPIKDTDQIQELTIDLNREDHEGSEIVIVYCDCGPANEEQYGSALRHNLRMPYGALAVRDAQSGSRFVMFNTLLKEDMSPLELCKSAGTVANRSVHVREDLQRMSE